MTSVVVTGTLTVDVSATVDDTGILDVHAAALRIPYVPHGVPVRVEIGRARYLDSNIGPIAEQLRPARSVEVIGSHAAGVAEVRRRLAAAFTRTGAAQ